MKATLVLALGATLISAQNFNGIPQCAIACLQQYVPQVGCAIEDTACQCQSDKQAALAPLIAPCLTSSCSAGDLTTAITASGAICAGVAVSSVVSSVLTPSTTSPPGSSGTGGPSATGAAATTSSSTGAAVAATAAPVAGAVAAVLGFAAFL